MMTSAGSAEELDHSHEDSSHNIPNVLDAAARLGPKVTWVVNVHRIRRYVKVYMHTRLPDLDTLDPLHHLIPAVLLLP
jgi:hypothetical protein